MSKQKPKKKNSDEEIRVKLKPFLGMKPGLYLTIIYAVIIAAVLFILLVVPGLTRNGTSIEFTTDPADASVWIDDAFAGTTPCRVFIEKGEHTLLVRKPYHTEVNQTLQVGGRVFGSLFIPRREVRADVLTVSNLEEYLAWVHQEFNGWALIDNFHPSYQPPPLLTQTMAGLFTSEIDATESEQLRSFLLSTMRGVNNEVLLRDFINALALYASGGDGVSPVTFLKMLDLITELAETEPYLPLWVYRAVPVEFRQRVAQTDWFSQALSHAASSGNESLQHPAVTGSALDLFGNRFIPLSGGSFLMGIGNREDAAVSESEVFLRLDAGFPLPVRAEIKGFFILDTEVSKEQYTAFLNENTQWRKQNLTSLVDQGMVTEEYLKNWDEIGSGDPVTFVSWYAAQAYCAWLETKLPAAITGYTVRLPSEAEWEWAASAQMDADTAVFIRRGGSGPAPVSDSGVNTLGVYGLSGNVWEWCSSWYYDFPYLSNNETERWPGTEKSVRGGCWANNEEEIGIETRGSQPPIWCTPFLGFRPVIVRD